MHLPLALMTLVAITTSLQSASAPVVPATRPLPPLSAARIEQISAWLPDAPTHFAPPFTDRAFWSPWTQTPAGRAIITQAATLSTTPQPLLTETLFDDFKRTGNRNTYEKPFNERMVRLGILTFAEGLENEGRHLPQIHKEFAAILDEPSWAASAHAGRQRTSWKSNYDNVDLAAAARAWSLATIDWLLSDRLPPGLRTRLRKEVRARVLEPYLLRARAHEADTNFGWMNVGHNWNPVCNAGVMGAALLLLDPRCERHEQAEFVAAFEAYAPAYLAGFGDDGYCVESLGYWNYGFGHFILGSETIRRVTGGRLDLLNHLKTRAIAGFGLRWEIAGGLYPAFGDVTPGHKPAPWILDFSASRFRLGATTGSPASFDAPHPLGPHLYRVLFDLTIPRPREQQKNENRLALRDWFPDGGALISRPVRPATGLAVAMKGGHNLQPHNHNDLGSFVIVNNGQLILSDLGADSYTRALFHPEQRYTSALNNSFGHPVPRVAGKLQRTSKDARAETVSLDFTDTRDLWEIDITSAYTPDVPSLKRLTRTFILTRDDNSATATGGCFEIIDRVKFETPQAFGNALILDPRQHHAFEDRNMLRVQRGKQSLRVTWTAIADGKSVQLHTNSEPLYGIIPDQAPKGKRLGFDLQEPAGDAEIHLLLTP